MAGEKQAAAQSCEEEKRLLVSLLSEAYEQQKTEAKLRKLRKCAMIGEPNAASWRHHLHFPLAFIPPPGHPPFPPIRLLPRISIHPYTSP